ncbi:DUF1986 domain-containing protein [Grimontia sp. S25]|uniref:DUF1986 domain-containing protein n=1 Tax=Grimontia sedimenti TaxID=2711294 RepID=A0A6M1R9U2_9GAMM|nr:DUF1986 domain-containing protein [Grimontia sedimenti]NGN97244.1 DUF1986 domain-containing protein [Grimontia sedimenti]
MKGQKGRALLLSVVGMLSAFTISADEPSPSPAIVNGSYAEIANVPWQVALTIDGYQICGGIIIGEKHVLTAAHCVVDTSANELKVVTSHEDMQYIDEDKILSVSQIDVHPSYNDYYLTSDIALLHLTTAVPGTASPIAILPPEKQLELDAEFAVAETRNLFVSGGGRRVLILTQADSYNSL